MAKTKPIMNVVFVGHVDAGKSTTVGRLMFDGGAVSEQEMKKLKEEAAKNGKAGFEFAYVMDSIKEERERGVTIDLSYKKLVTQKYEITIIDAPGHRDFVKNMITGASQADAAFLVIAAPSGVQPQTTEHLWLLRTMGVKTINVVINKMDAVEYKEDVYNKVKEEVGKLLAGVGINPANTAFIAVSSLQGDNVGKKTDKMSWMESKAVELKDSDDFDIPHFVKMGLRTSFYHLDTESYLMAGKAAELLNWHAGTHFCGYCGGKMEFHTDISKVCCRCHREIWPKLSPAIIVLIRRKDEILLVQSNTFKSDYYGLVAGFVETGESFEDCVHREVREETGLEITNLHYFGSQPWPYPRNIMAGFEADYLKGELQLQLSELNKGGWFRLD